MTISISRLAIVAGVLAVSVICMTSYIVHVAELAITPAFADGTPQ